MNLHIPVQVVATQSTGTFVERSAIRGALRALTRADDVPDTAGAWTRWYRENKDSLVADATE